MKQTANKTVYIDHWFTWYGEPNNEGVIATQLPNGKWVCELKLPLINQTVKSVASTAANAMENASSKAIPLVEKYLSKHPNTTFVSKSQIRHYEFYTDEYGFTGFRVNPEYRKKIGNDMLKKQLEAAKVLERAVARIAKINGTDKNLFVQVADKSLFDESDTTEDIQRKIRNKLLGNTSDWHIAWQVTSVVDNCVIASGLIIED